MLRRATFTAVTLLWVLGASACAPGSPETPSSTTSEAAPTTSAVPKVENPKNLKSITDACQLLTQDQLSQLGGGTDARPPQGETSALGEPKCNWRNNAFSTAVTINTKHGGLTEITKIAESSDNFKPTQVDGYQGARVDEQSALCRVEIAIADDQSVAINYFRNSGGKPEMNDPCGFAEKITSEVLKNIPDA
ncbi:DUF3558 domain-containing protein [Saccharopolyspora phatthalungensis]|uniref:DUF3558 domain-containing protein n=1 Tax=Saccharopolyspora phatthalungensis TaxID=664693 RepID=A0A840Q534_9PSEU|nr:DUF3558 domain-containing protein [Saccharopolyspora phatthalungensis]MBB5153799.1 hypothetical protein [Saccharopolyspora phatthalungensis]